ncbi:MAG: efflux RND transporter periplasmic adaptor subunit [Vicinamibacterales bacterium]
MTQNTNITLSRATLILGAIALLLAGASVTYLLSRTSNSSIATGAAQPAQGGEAQGRDNAPSVAGSADGTYLPDVVIPLSPEMSQRAGIVVGQAIEGPAAAAVRLPGVVEPNAYRAVVVTSLVGGRLTEVSANLGQAVRRGQTLARIYSPELADAQRRYVSERAVLEAHDQELQRTQALVQAGAASQQELERIHAEHTAQVAAVESAQSALALLGVDVESAAPSPNAMISVPAPLDGVVTERSANVGLNVDAATKLFTVVDLSSVWIVADVYERDLSRVKVGTEVSVTTLVSPDRPIVGRISYIEPEVRPETRTAKVRIEVPNPQGQLKLGMYVEVQASGVSTGVRVLIPRTAVQNVGDRTVVYLVNQNQPESFTEREVRLGSTAGDQIEVITGLRAGDLVVVDGSFFVKAERERLGLRTGTDSPSALPTGVSQSTGVVTSPSM